MQMPISCDQESSTFTKRYRRGASVQGVVFLVFCVADNFTCNVSVTSTNISKYTNSLRAVCHTVCLLARGTDAVFSGERKE